MRFSTAGLNNALLNTFGESVTIDDVSIRAIVRAVPSSAVMGNIVVDRPDPAAWLRQSDVQSLGADFELKSGQTLIDASGNEFRVTFVGRADHGMIELSMRPVS